MTESQVEYGTYIQFIPAPPKAKTKVWWVVNDGDQLGWIAWFPRWRKYAFRPKEETWFEEVCLREIAEFCVTQTRKHKERR